MIPKKNSIFKDQDYLAKKSAIKGLVQYRTKNEIKEHKNIFPNRCNFFHHCLSIILNPP